MTFTNNEPTNDDWSAAAAQTPAAAPFPRHGGQFSTDPRTPTLAYLWQGNTRGLSQEYVDHAQPIWQYNMVNNAWTYKPTSQPNNPDSGYTMQYTNMIPQNTVYTSSSTAGGVNPALTKSNWDNQQTLQLDTSLEPNPIAKVVFGSSILIERQNASGSAQSDRQTFHGTVVGIPDYNGN